MSSKKKSAKSPAFAPLKTRPGAEGSALFVFYPSNTLQTFRAEFIGVRPSKADTINPKGLPTPVIRLSVESDIPVSCIGVKGAINSKEPALLSKLRQTGAMARLPAGKEIFLPPDVVIVDRNATSYDAVIYAPEPGTVDADPLWPARLAGEKAFPSPLPFISDWNKEIRQFRYFTPEGITGTLTGRFGFNSVVPNAKAGTIPLKPGVIPGIPAIFLTEPAPLPDNDATFPNGEKIEVLPGDTIAELAFDWVILDTFGCMVMYYPPCKNPADPTDTWPARVVNSPAFPEEATYAGTLYRVRDYPEGPVHRKPFKGYAGFERLPNQADVDNGFTAPIPDPLRRFALESRTSDKPMTFADAEALRNAFVSLIEENPVLSLRYLCLRHEGQWRQTKDVLISTYQNRKNDPSTFENMERYLACLIGGLNTADIVLWEPALADEAAGGSGADGQREKIAEWMGKPFPSRLLSQTKRPQFHLMSSGLYVMNTPELMATWGLDIPCLLSGFLLDPMLTNPASVSSSDFSLDPFPLDPETTGVYVCFFFMPIPRVKNGIENDLSPDQAFFRARWLLPLLCDGRDDGNSDNAIHHGYAAVAAMLEFMNSPRIEVAPEIWKEPDDEEASRLETARDKARQKPRPAQDRQYITLRRVEIAPEVLESLNLESSPSEERGEVTEGFYRKAHTRKVRYGPGRKFVREEVPIARARVRKDLPLKAGAEEAVVAREEADKKPRYMRVVR